jgi:hypothetical protein
VITPRSHRTYFEALDRVGLAHPACNQEHGELFLQLLVAGVDHELVDTEVWYQRIVEGAPDRRTFFDALDLAGLPYPRRNTEVGERFLDLLIEGMDHDLVNTEFWFQHIYEDAPDRRRRRRSGPWR